MYSPVNIHMTTENLTRFKNEINRFFALVLRNLVFGAMAMAFGMQFIVTSVLGMTGTKTFADTRSRVHDGGKTYYVVTEEATDYITLFFRLYQQLFDTIPGFKL